MASFIEELWNGVFTPGPTPPLLLATNASFAALQLVLLALLLATYSIHFIVLSGLCAALWGSINWFAKEVMAVQAAADRDQRADQSNAATSSDAPDSGDDTDTQLPAAAKHPRTAGTSSSGAGAASESGAVVSGSSQTLPPSAANLAASKSEDGVVRQRRTLADSTGDLSTDSEWEKVDDDQ